MLLHTCRRRWLLHTRACQHLLFQSSATCWTPSNSILHHLRSASSQPSASRFDVQQLQDELQLATADRFTYAQTIIDHEWPRRAPLALENLRQEVRLRMQISFGSTDRLPNHVLAATNQLLDPKTDPRVLCKLALLAGVASNGTQNKGPRKGPLKPSQAGNRASQAVHTIVQYFTTHTVDGSKLSANDVLALVAGAHMGNLTLEEQDVQELVKLCQSKLKHFSLCQLTTLLSRLSSVSERNVPVAFVQAVAKTWVRRLEVAVDVLGGCEEPEGPVPVPPSAQISALLWMRHTLAIQTCIAVCAWQCARPFQHGERSDLDETRPNVDIDIPARLVGAQAKYVGLARWPAEGLLGFAYMGLTADHPTILALAESLTHQLPHVMHQHMLYLCTAVMYLKGLPATLDYEALGRRANQLLLTMQRRGLQELLLCMKVVGHAPDSLDRRVLGQAIMANTVGRRYVPPTLSALHVLGWIPPNVDVDRLLSSIDPEQPIRPAWVLQSLQVCAQHARYVSQPVAATLLTALTNAEAIDQPSPVTTATLWCQVLPCVAQSRLHIPESLLQLVVKFLADCQPFVEPRVLVEAMHAVAVSGANDGVGPLLSSWMEFAAEYVDNIPEALDATLARQLLESAVLFSRMEASSATLLPPALEQVCENLVLQGPLEGPATRLQGVAAAAEAVPALLDVSAEPKTVEEALVVADAYATLRATGLRVALRAPLQMLIGAPTPVMAGMDSAQSIVAQGVGVHIVEVDPQVWLASSTEPERTAYLADCIQHWENTLVA